MRCVAVEENLLLAGAADGRVRAYDLRRTAAPFATVRCHDDCVNSLALDARLGWLVTGGDDAYVSVVRVPSMLRYGRVGAGVGLLALAMDHSRIVAGGEDQSLRVRARACVRGELAWCVCVCVYERRPRKAHPCAPSVGLPACKRPD